MSVLGLVTSLPATAIGLLSPHGHKARPGSVTGSTGTRAAAASGTGGTSATGGSSTTTGSSATDASNIGSTFLNLLVKELQNQDPTAPMDSTAMVGQMISLNQLDQLIAINQAVTPATTSTATAGGTTGSSGGGTTGGTTGGATGYAVKGLTASGSSSSADALAARTALMAANTPGTANGAAPFSADATLNAAAASTSNAGVLNLNSFNSIFGGK